MYSSNGTNNIRYTGGRDPPPLALCGRKQILVETMDDAYTVVENPIMCRQALRSVRQNGVLQQYSMLPQGCGNAHIVQGGGGGGRVPATCVGASAAPTIPRFYHSSRAWTISV